MLRATEHSFSGGFNEYKIIINRHFDVMFGTP